MECRKTRRAKNNKEIVLVDEDRQYPALLTSISRNGMSARCDHVFPTYKEIVILFPIENRQLEIRGSVRWVNEHAGGQKDRSKEIGILIKDPPEEFINYVNDKCG